jgi:hypothetical protein
MVSSRQPYEKVSRVTQIVMPALELAGCGARWRCERRVEE